MDKSIVITPLKGYVPPDGAYTKMVLCGGIIEVTTSERKPQNLKRYKRFDRNHYIDTQTGELLSYAAKSNSEKCQKRRFPAETLRQLINTNFNGNQNELHIVLTYAEKMKDRARLTCDFKKFMKNLLYRYPGCMYIGIPEVQKRGSWHIHLLFKNKAEKSLFIPREVLESIWVHGFVWVKHILKNNNIGAYFVSKMNYLPGNEDTKGKKHFHCSRNIKRPEIIRTTYEQAKLIIGKTEPFYQANYEVISNGQKVNRISKQQYRNRKCKKEGC